MNCKNDCLHYNVCNYHIDEETPFSVTECNNFKNKADFVEVVRCKKCKYGDVSTISNSKDGQEEIACYCTLKNRVTDLDSYCPSGERKQKNDFKE